MYSRAHKWFFTPFTQVLFIIIIIILNYDYSIEEVLYKVFSNIQNNRK